MKSLHKLLVFSTYKDILLTGVRIMIEQDSIVDYLGGGGTRGFG